METRNTVVGAIVLVAVVGLGIWLYNRANNNTADDTNAAANGYLNSTSTDNGTGSTTTPTYDTSFEPTAS